MLFESFSIEIEYKKSLIRIDMGKNRRRKKARQQLATVPASSSKGSEKPSLMSRGGILAKRIGLIVGSFFAGHAAGAILDLWSPYWPTEPVLTWEPVEINHVGDTRFYIINEGSVFDFHNLDIACVFVVGAPLKGPMDIGTRVVKDAHLEAGTRRAFKCRISAEETPRRLELYLDLAYELDFPLRDWKRNKIIGPLVWDSSTKRWLVNEPFN